MKKIILVTGGFDPLHSGHIAYFKAARALGDHLIVGINSDEWLTNKKGQPFMPWHERAEIIRNLSVVDEVIAFDDSDGSAKSACYNVKKQYPDDTVVFANGGDRTAKNIPEMSVPGIVFSFGVGGSNKMNSSSWILEEWRAPKTERPWGYYRVLHEVDGAKVKELTVNPGCSLSMQRHQQRSEFWMVTEGSAVLVSMSDREYVYPPKTLQKHESVFIPVTLWHKLTNPFDVPCRIVEIQYGELCNEEDIERK